MVYGQKRFFPENVMYTTLGNFEKLLYHGKETIHSETELIIY